MCYCTIRLPNAQSLVSVTRNCGHWQSFEKIERLPVMVAFFRKLTSKAGTNWFFKNMSPNKFAELPHTIECNNTLGTITIGWSQFQSASNKPLKLFLVCRCGLLLLAAIWQKNQHWALCKPRGETEKWLWLPILVAHAQIVTKVGSQNFAVLCQTA